MEKRDTDPLRLLVLGCLYQKDLHPYQVIQRLKTAYVHRYVKVRYGSLYYAFHRLAKGGLIRAVKKSRTRGRPERTVYAITTTGRRAFERLLLVHFEQMTPVFHPLFPALLFAHLAAPEALAERLRRRIEIQELALTGLRQISAAFGARLRGGTRAILRNGLAHQRAELEWTKSFLKEVEGRLL